MNEKDHAPATGSSRRAFMAATAATAAVTMLNTSSTVASAQPADCGLDPNALLGKTPPGFNYTLYGSTPSGKRRIPDPAGTPVPPANQEIYDSLDLMAYLTYALPFEYVFSSTAKSIPTIIRDVFLPRLDANDQHWERYFKDANGDPDRVKRDAIVAEFEVIASLNATETFRDLYEQPTDPVSTKKCSLLTAGSPLQIACERMENVRQLEKKFCFPFLRVQRLGARDIDPWLEYFGCLSLYDLLVLSSKRTRPRNNGKWEEAPSGDGILFVNQQTIEELQQVEHAATSAASDVGVLQGGCKYTNGYKCSLFKNECLANYSNCFCTIAEDDHCSIISCCV